MNEYRVVGLVAIAGLAAGVALTMLTYLLARFGPQGDSWSYRGNGAHVVPFGLGPAALAAGWTMLAAHFRSSRRWSAFGLAALAVGTALAVIGGAALPVGGLAAERIVSPVALVALLVWPFAAPVLAALLPLPARTTSPGLGAYLAAGAALPVAMVVGFYGSAGMVRW